MTTQFKKGIIELCVLKIINDKEMYGFEVMETLTNELKVNENTIYPLLRRLTGQGLFETYQKETVNGAPRKYYKITEKGKKFLLKNLNEWQVFLKEVNNVLEGEKNYE
ncbi:MAG: PadR family transcriptional regulator [Acholeplasma sp.]|nr:PadR family transcriptional regulator [Acholeplasma sp.]